MPYRAGAGSGMFGSHSYGETRPQVDVSGILDALGAGASQIVRAHLLRKQAERNAAQQAEQLTYQRGRDTVADQRYGEEQQYRRSTDAQGRADRLASEGARNALEKAKQDREDALAGYVAPHDESQLVDASVQMPGMEMAPVQSPIHRAFVDPMHPGAGPLPAQMPAQQVTPEAAPRSIPPLRMAMSAPGAVNVPGHYDANQGEKAILARLRESGLVTRDEAKQDFTAEQNRLRLEAQERGRQVLAASNMALAKFRADRAAVDKRNPVARPMTASQESAFFVSVASDYLNAHGGNIGDAYADLANTPEGRDAIANGLTLAHFHAANAKRVEGLTKSSIGIVGKIAETPAAAADTVNALQRRLAPRPAPADTTPSTRADTAAVVRGGGGHTGLTTPPDTGSFSRGPGGNILPTAPVAPTAPPIRVDLRTPDGFSNEELLEAKAAGMVTPADAKAYILAQRKKKAVAPAAAPGPTKRPPAKAAAPDTSIAPKPTATATPNHRAIVERDADGRITGFRFTREEAS